MPETTPTTPHPRRVRVTCMTNPDCPDHAIAKHVDLPYLGNGVYVDPGYTSGSFVCGMCSSGMPMDRGPSYSAV